MAFQGRDTGSYVQTREPTLPKFEMPEIDLPSGMTMTTEPMDGYGQYKRTRYELFVNGVSIGRADTEVLDGSLTKISAIGLLNGKINGESLRTNPFGGGNGMTQVSGIGRGKRNTEYMDGRDLKDAIEQYIIKRFMALITAYGLKHHPKEG